MVRLIGGRTNVLTCATGELTGKKRTPTMNPSKMIVEMISREPEITTENITDETIFVENANDFFDMIKNYMGANIPDDQDRHTVEVRVCTSYDESNKPSLIVLFLDKQMYLMEIHTAITGAVILPMIANDEDWELHCEGSVHALNTLAEALNHASTEYISELNKTEH